MLIFSNIQIPLGEDADHADATNNIGAVLTALPPDDRVKIAKASGLLPTLSRDSESNHRKTMWDNVALVDEMVERLFHKTLQIDGSHRWALNNLGLHMHSHGRDGEVG